LLRGQCFCVLVLSFRDALWSLFKSHEPAVWTAYSSISPSPHTHALLEPLDQRVPKHRLNPGTLRATDAMFVQRLEDVHPLTRSYTTRLRTSPRPPHSGMPMLRTIHKESVCVVDVFWCGLAMNDSDPPNDAFHGLQQLHCVRPLGREYERLRRLYFMSKIIYGVTSVMISVIG
jgi:hypothetical protein